MQSTDFLQTLPIVQQHIQQTANAWASHPNHQTLIDFRVGPRWLDFYLSEFDALVKQALPPLHPLQSTPILNTDAVIEPGVRFVLSPLTISQHPAAVENVMKRSVFAFGFHEVIAKATTYESFLEQIEAAANAQHTALSPLLQSDTTFTLKFDIFKGSLSRTLQNEIRDTILSRIPNLASTVNIKTPQHIYTLHIVCQQLDERIFSPEMITEQKILPYAFYLCKSMREKTSPEDFATSFALTSRPYIGPTSCDPILAFSMANLSQCSATSHVFDPFSGTGSILVSCCKFSPNVIGQDLDISTLFGLYRGKEAKHEEYEKKLVLLEKEKADYRSQPRQSSSQSNSQNPESTSHVHSTNPKQKQKQLLQLRGLCKQKNFNIFDNFNHYSFPRPELICSDSSHSPYRIYQYTGSAAQAPKLPHLQPQSLPHNPIVNVMPGFILYKTKQGNPATPIDKQIYAQQCALELDYISNTVVPQQTAIINKYLLRYNQLACKSSQSELSAAELESLEQIAEEEKAAQYRHQLESQYHPIKVFCDVIACDPPYGIRARAAKIASCSLITPSTSPAQQEEQQIPSANNNNEDAASYMVRVRGAARWKKDKFKTLEERQAELQRAGQLEPQEPSPSPSTPTAPTTVVTSVSDPLNTNQDNLKSRRLFKQEDIAIHRYIPETVHNPMQNVLYDLFHFSAQRLPIGGKLVYLLPTAKPYPRDQLPFHPCFSIKYACLQDLPTWFSRWAIVMEKTTEYQYDMHHNWINEQLQLGVPIWSPSVSARARIMANCAHQFPIELLFAAKAHIDKYGYDDVATDELQ